jgi:hypothetical protein
MADRCYFCDAPATSKEHVPPKCLFPKLGDIADGVDYRKNLITVRSCDTHNAAKSRDDEYLQLILIFGYFNNAAGRAHFTANVVRALTRRPAILAALYADQTPVMVDAQPTVAVNVDRARFNAALERVSQGLCVSETGRRWQKPIEIHTPVLLAADEPEADRVNQLVTNVSRAVVDCLKDTEKRGANSDIFWYQLLVDEAKDRMLCRMVFYGGFDVFAVSDPRLSRSTHEE